MGGGGQQRRWPPVGAAAARGWRTSRGRAGQVVRAGTRARHTGHNRKTDAHDAHAVAVVAVRTAGLRVLAYDAQLEALRLLADRRDELSKSRVQAANRLHRLLAELVPGQSKKNITTGQAKAILATVRSRDVVGKTRRRLAAEQITELVAVEKKIKTLTRNSRRWS